MLSCCHALFPLSQTTHTSTKCGVMIINWCLCLYCFSPVFGLYQPLGSNNFLKGTGGFVFLLKYVSFVYFLERGAERQKERKRNMDVREKH